MADYKIKYTGYETEMAIEYANTLYHEAHIGEYDVNYNTSSINISVSTSDGDEYGYTINSATTTTAGLMTSTDKVALNNLQRVVTTSHNGLMSMEDKSKLDKMVVNLSGVSQLPTLSAIFVYDDMLTHHRTVYDMGREIEGKYGYYHIFCCEHDGEYEAQGRGYRYIVFNSNLEKVKEYDESSSTIPNVILAAFGELAASTSRDGLMSKEDKQKVDNMVIDLRSYNSPGSSSVLPTFGSVFTYFGFPAEVKTFFSGRAIRDKFETLVAMHCYDAENTTDVYWVFDKDRELIARYYQYVNTPDVLKNLFG